MALDSDLIEQRSWITGLDLMSFEMTLSRYGQVILISIACSFYKEHSYTWVFTSRRYYQIAF
jgi:hypothetical protein